MIQNLKENQTDYSNEDKNEIFVFGSNRNGNHGGGAALQAKEYFGAQEGVGEGMTGRCYAFPTLDEDMQQESEEELKISVQKLYQVCRENSDKEFLLTKVGCGIAGYKELFIKSLFTNPPHNLVLPEDWK